MAEGRSFVEAVRDWGASPSVRARQVARADKSAAHAQRRAAASARQQLKIRMAGEKALKKAGSSTAHEVDSQQQPVEADIAEDEAVDLDASQSEASDESAGPDMADLF